MDFDVVVVGGGHAGVEAAFACANIGHKVALISLDIKNIAQAPCNPSIGGPAKGVVVREIDALGGMMGIATDHTYIQMKMLNTSKGPGVQCLRAQIDKLKYPTFMQDALKAHKNITLIESMVTSLIIEDKKCRGVILENGTEIKSKCTILTTGTYLESTILVGKDITVSGPFGQRSAHGLSPQLAELGFKILRLKTGTPPRIRKDSIDFSQGEIQWGSEKPVFFSYSSKKEEYIPCYEQTPCYLIHTKPLTHQIILANLKESAMYSGNVKGRGPRYCPSIEDKIVRFADKERHQLFLEPESNENDSIYIQGFSTSMPHSVQEIMVRSLPGLERAEFIHYAYAIEYDAIYPTQLKLSLETKIIDNLFTAGQINGTSGYEEAAGQGLIAGINASLKILNKEPLILKRSESYIGLMIDDLITKGTNEPYRLLTSRSEYRLLLRHDNADIRLREYGYQVGLIKEETHEKFVQKLNDISSLRTLLETIKVKECDNKIISYASSCGYDDNFNGLSLAEFIKRPNIELASIMSYLPNDEKYNDDVIEQVEIQIKYEGYIKKQEKEARELNRLDNYKIPQDINYDDVNHLAIEARQKLKEIRPETIGQASRISGVNPSDIAILLVFLKIK